MPPNCGHLDISLKSTRIGTRGIIDHMRKVSGGNLWFPTGIELAEYCLNNVFQAEAKKLRASAG